MRLHIEKEGEFTEKFNSIKTHYECITPISPDKLTFIEGQLSEIMQKQNRSLFMYVVIFGIVCLPIYLLVLNYCYRINFYIPDISHLLKIKSTLLSNYLNINFICAFLVALLWMIFGPIIIRKRPATSFKPNRSYKVFVIFYVYLALPLLLISLYNFKLIPREFISRAFIQHGLEAWVSSFVALIPTIALFLITVPYIFLMLFIESKQKPERTSVKILYNIVILIHYIHINKSDVFINDNKKNVIVGLITKTSKLINDLFYGMKFNDKISNWANFQIKLAVDNFMVLNTWVCFPMEDTFENLIKKLIEYLNVFISGTYHMLPREEVDNLNNGMSLKRWRIKSYIPILTLAIFIAIPLIIYLLLITYFKLSINSTLSPLLTVLYFIWIGLCFIVSTDNLGNESKNTILQWVNMLFSRK